MESDTNIIYRRKSYLETGKLLIALIMEMLKSFHENLCSHNVFRNGSRFR